MATFVWAHHRLLGPGHRARAAASLRARGQGAPVAREGALPQREPPRRAAPAAAVRQHELELHLLPGAQLDLAIATDQPRDQLRHRSQDGHLQPPSIFRRR
jgi:hypothetical protein